MSKQLISFVLKFTGSILLLLLFHWLVFFFRNVQFDPAILISSYIVNLILALLIIVLIIRYINKLKSYIGFLFMIGSLLKFAVFFIWFYPIFIADGNMETVEFSMFFVPYLVCLIFETKKLSNILNKL